MSEPAGPGANQSPPAESSGQPTPLGAGCGCWFSRIGRLLPFWQCAYCDQGRLSRCQAARAVSVLVGVLAVACVAAGWLGGRTGQTLFISAGLTVCLLLVLLNLHSTRRLPARLRLVQLHNELERQQEFLTELAQQESLNDSLETILDNACSRLRCRRASIMLPDEQNEHLYIAAARGVPAQAVATTRIPVGMRTSDKVFQQGRPVHVHDPSQLGGLALLSAQAGGFMSGPLMLSGMRWGGVRVGVLSVTEPLGRPDFTPEEEFIFNNICMASAVAIFNHLVAAKADRATVEFLETLVKAIEARDEYTCGHSERVCQYAMAIGKRVLLTEEAQRNLRVAARLHDLGKIGIPDAVLNKPGRLTEEEWAIVRRHPDIAAEMLEGASLVAPAIAGIRHHHERLDGTGYPHHLHGQRVPLLARIIGVADAFDAMTTARPYRKPLDLETAVAELEKGIGSQFDADCARALLQALEHGEIQVQIEGREEVAKVA